MKSKEFKKLMARRMLKSQYKINVGSKGRADEIFKARLNKKRLPSIPIPHKGMTDRDAAFRATPMDKFLKEHPEWQI